MYTAVVVVCILLMVLVRPDPAFLWWGLALLAVGTVFFEFASVNYNAMLTQVSTRATIGRVSGFGWGMGYVGGIVLLLIVYVGFISPEVGLFGGVLAQGTFGFSAGDVILFAIAANVVAGVATIAVGTLDDRVGPQAVIVASLIGLIVTGSLLFTLHDAGATALWLFGLLLCLFVGPAQSASRSYLARLTPEGREGEIFGLYATTGRAASFLAPAAFATAVSIATAASGATEANVQYWGILGLVLVLAVGLALLIPVRRPPSSTRPAPEPQRARPAP